MAQKQSVESEMPKTNCSTQAQWKEKKKKQNSIRRDEKIAADLSTQVPRLGGESADEHSSEEFRARLDAAFRHKGGRIGKRTREAIVNGLRAKMRKMECK